MMSLFRPPSLPLFWVVVSLCAGCGGTSSIPEKPRNYITTLPRSDEERQRIYNEILLTILASTAGASWGASLIY